MNAREAPSFPPPRGHHRQGGLRPPGQKADSPLGRPSCLSGILVPRLPSSTLATCLTTSLVYVESTREGDIDLRGGLRFFDDVRNGFEQMHVTVTIEGYPAIH